MLIFCISLPFVIVNEESVDFGLLVGLKKQLEMD